MGTNVRETTQTTWNRGVAFVPNPSIYGPRRPSRLNYYVACQSARRSVLCLHFLDNEQANAPQYPMFKMMLQQVSLSDAPEKSRQHDIRTVQQSDGSRQEKERAIGKRAGGRTRRTTQPTRGMSLQTEEKPKSKPTRTTPEESSSSEETDMEKSSKRLETPAPSPKQPEEHNPKCSTLRIDQKVGTQPPVNIGKPLVNAVPINTIDKMKTGAKMKIHFNIESSPDKTPSPTKLSLKLLIQELGFSDKTAEYQACMKLLEAISPKNRINIKIKHKSLTLSPRWTATTKT